MEIARRSRGLACPTGCAQRREIWAFGAVLFEMLTGQRAFRGDSAADTVAAIIRGDRSRPPAAKLALALALALGDSETPPTMRKFQEV